MQFTINKTLSVDLNPDELEPAVKIIAELKERFPADFDRVLDGLLSLLLLREIELSKPGTMDQLLASLSAAQASAK